MYVERTEKVVNESSTLTKNFYFPKILLGESITRRNLYLVSLNAYLCEKYSSRVCHWAITATAVGIIHVNYYIKPWQTLTLSLIPPQKLNTVSCCFQSWTKNKSSKLSKPPLVKSSPSTGLTVSSQSLTDFLLSFEKIRPWARGLRIMRVKTIGRG